MCRYIANRIVVWLQEYSVSNKTNGFVVGVSGGIDSATVSTLCAKTGLKTVVVSMPIRQDKEQLARAERHCAWLVENYPNVETKFIELDKTFNSFAKLFNDNDLTEKSLANSKSRLRMVTLYNLANAQNLLVAGTGNKVEDYGVGFFTKFGDGGVDISPIGDLLKSEVRELAAYLEINQEIIDAKPTDGLWADNRTDEDQIGATYEELEWAMNFCDRKLSDEQISDRQKEVLKIYQNLHETNSHKMQMPPICTKDFNKILIDNIDFHCINLKNRTDKREQFKSEISKVNLKVKFFDGCEPNYRLQNFNLSHQKPGQQGCFASHISLMQNHTSNKILGIFEDDAEFCDDFALRLKYVEKYFDVEDWDIFFLSAFYHHNSHWHKKDWDLTDTKYIHRVYGAFTTHSYLINPKSINKIIKKLHDVHHKATAIDHAFILIEPELKCYSFTPGMVTQRESMSDINHEVFNQTNYFLGKAGQHIYAKNMKDFDYDNYYKDYIHQYADCPTYKQTFEQLVNKVNPKHFTKTALVLGAGGFIGGHLSRYLKTLGYYVRGVDLKKHEYFDLENDIDDFVVGDLRDINVVNKVIDQQFDEVYQLAADMGGAGFVFTGENDADILHNSALINLHVSKRCAEMKVKKVFYSSSACMYPAYNQEDPQNPKCSEESAYPANPDSEYGWEKLFSEHVFLSFMKNYGLNVRIARFHNIFGPQGTWQGGREKAPAAICRKVAMAKNSDEIEIWGDGLQTRSFLYIDECIKATYRLMQSDFTGPVNIGSEEMVTINHLLDMIAEIAGKKLTRKNIAGPVGVRGRNSDNKLYKEKLGWCVSQPLSTGLKKTYEWIEQQCKENKQS